MGALRSLASTLLAVYTCGLAVVAITATWMHRQVLETDHWTATSVEVLRDPEVRELAAAFLADALVAQQQTADGVIAAATAATGGAEVRLVRAGPPQERSGRERAAAGSPGVDPSAPRGSYSVGRRSIGSIGSPG